MRNSHRSTRLVSLSAALVLGAGAALVPTANAATPALGSLSATGSLELLGSLSNLGPFVPTPPSTSTPVAQWDRELLDLVNKERTTRGLHKLTWNGSLAAGAKKWSQHMAQTQRMHHAEGNFGENVAYGYSSPASVMRGWMNSAGHRANILHKDYTSFGAGVAKASNGQYYWTQRFTF